MTTRQTFGCLNLSKHLWTYMFWYDKLVTKRIYLSSLSQIIAQFHLAFISKHFGINVSCLFTYENVFASNDGQKMKRSYLTGFMATWWNYTLIQTFCMIIWWNYAIINDNWTFAHKSYNINSDDHEHSWSKKIGRHRKTSIFFVMRCLL